MFSFTGKSAILVTGLLCRLSQSKPLSLPYPTLTGLSGTECLCKLLEHPLQLSCAPSLSYSTKKFVEDTIQSSDFHSRLMTRLLSIIKFNNNSQFCKYVHIIISCFALCGNHFHHWEIHLVCIMHGNCCDSNIVHSEREMCVSRMRFATKICLTGFVNILYICDDKISV